MESPRFACTKVKFLLGKSLREITVIAAKEERLTVQQTAERERWGSPSHLGDHRLPSQAINAVHEASVFNVFPVEFPNFKQKCLLQSR